MDSPRTFPATDPQQAIAQGSPAVAGLMLALSTALVGRAMVGRLALPRLRRTQTG